MSVDNTESPRIASILGWPVHVAMLLGLGEPLLLGGLFDAQNLILRGTAGVALASAGYGLTLLSGVAAALVVLVYLRPSEIEPLAEELSRSRPSSGCLCRMTSRLLVSTSHSSGLRSPARGRPLRMLLECFAGFRRGHSACHARCLL